MSALRRHTRIGLAAIAAVASAALTFADLPAAFFPADVSTPRDEAAWKTLAETLPHRVRIERAATVGDRDTPPATRLEIRPGIGYVRVRRLARDLSVIESALDEALLLLDLRFVAAGQDESLRFGALLAREPISLPAPMARETADLVVKPAEKRGAAQRTVILVNRQTSGPIEAVLAALQQAGDVLLVGRPTAGDTGFFLPVPDFPRVSVIAGEFVATRGVSLLDRGAQPGLLVDVDAESDESGYLALDGGSSLADLLDPPVNKARFDEAMLLREHAGAATRAARRSGQSDDGSDEKADRTIVSDRILQRALNTLIALHTLRPVSS